MEGHLNVSEPILSPECAQSDVEELRSGGNGPRFGKNTLLQVSVLFHNSFIIWANLWTPQ